jgi:serine/threonine protein kinase/CheY-like chemotaxis protein
MRDDVFGPFHLLERIGIGGMAEVFLARAEGAAADARPIVVKRILPQLSESPESIGMFLDEARLGEKLVHPHIVSVLEYGTADGTPYMVLPWIDGCDLGTLDGRAHQLGKRIPTVHVATIASAVARGLHAAHEAIDPKTGRALHVIHRDVSPSNVLLGKTGEIKVADFGVARSTTQSTRTATGTIKGKLSYMAPEQIHGTPLGRRSDIYSFGVLLWELLVGRRLHEKKSDVQVLKAVIDEEVPRVSHFRPSIPAELDALVARCVEKDPALRPTTAAAVADLLDVWRRHHRDSTEAAYRDWLAASAALFEPVDPTLRAPRRTPVEMAKPLISDEATPVLKRVKTPSSPKEGLKLAQKGPEKKRDRVLYVEDEAENRDVAELRLRRSYELLLAKNDEEACRILRDEGATLSAILMDIQLKGSALDGIELVHLIRGTLPDDKKPSYARGIAPLKLPVFFVTAYGGRYSTDELLKAGAERVVSKPVNFAELTLALIDVHLKKAVRT